MLPVLADESKLDIILM